jgi:hypothetical protein
MAGLHYTDGHVAMFPPICAESPAFRALSHMANSGGEMAMFPWNGGKMAISFQGWPYGHETARSGA